MAQFIGVPEVYPQLLELRKSKTASFKTNKYLKDDVKLRYYQVVGSLHMMLLSRMVLGDSTGLGKTIQSIAAYTFMLEKDPELKMLVVCQKSALYQWEDEFVKFTNGISTRVITNEYEELKLKGKPARMKHYEDFKENVLIISYWPLLEEYEFIKRSLGSKYMVIYDECVVFKNRKAKIHFSCENIAQSAQRAYGLSATIIKNGLEEVYGIYSVIVPGLFGKITHFRNKFCKQEMMDLVIKGRKRKIPKTVGYKNLGEFKNVLDPYFLLRKKEDVATELPKLISRQVLLEMEPRQKELYRDALNGIIYEERVKMEFFEVSDSMRNGANDKKTLKRYEELKEKYESFLSPEGKKRGKLAALTYCQMISNGPALINESGPSSKEAEFERLLTEELPTEKIIVYTRFKSGLPNLEIICDNNKIKYSKITGDVGDKDRRKAQMSFQEDPTHRVIFITAAGSSSLNLQSASTIIFIDTPWSYGDLAQAIGRAQRIGSIQDHVLLIHFVNKNTIDERVIQRVSEKKDLSDAIIGDTAEGALDFARVSDNVIEDLFSSIIEDAEKLK